MKGALRVVCLVAVLLWAASYRVVAQENRVFGYVTDAKNEPLVGVSVKVNGSKVMTVTNADGRYQLSGTWRRGTDLVFSYIGYATRHVRFDRSGQLNVQLEENANRLGEVVVRAKSNINAIDLRAKAGVVESVDMKRLTDKPMIDLGLA